MSLLLLFNSPASGRTLSGGPTEAADILAGVASHNGGRTVSGALVEGADVFAAFVNSHGRTLSGGPTETGDVLASARIRGVWTRINPPANVWTRIS